MYKLENRIGLRQFNVIREHFFKVINRHFFSVIRGLRPANLDPRVKPVDDNKVECVTSGNDICCSGRSMIEMLGVLAIIGVLSVGGIAGYSKAMEKYKLNKVMSEYSMLVYGILEHIDDFRKYSGSKGNSLSNVLEALDIIPKGWQRDEKNDFIDDNGYTIRVFNHTNDDYKGIITIDFYLGGYIIDDESNMVTDNFPSKACTEIINNIAVPLHNIMYRVWMYGSNAAYYGSAYCGDGKKCLKDVTLAEVQHTCTSCVKGSYCALVFYF